MGEYIDVGIQTSILPLSIILSSIVLGIFALFGEETENDDDDSDSGSGGLSRLDFGVTQGPVAKADQATIL